jgi:hypothetical protein
MMLIKNLGHHRQELKYSNKNYITHLNKKSICPQGLGIRLQELIPEVEDEEETLTCPGLPSASPLLLSNSLEQD